MNLLFVTAAKKLGADKEIMNSYWAYHERKQNWFFSPNPNLDAAERRPNSFPNKGSWDRLKSAERRSKWNSFSLKQRMTIATLAGFGHEGKGINLDNSIHFSKLRKGYMNWRSDLYSVFWSDKTQKKRWLCNVFVGDAIYLYNGKSFTYGNNHYFNPKQTFNGKSTLKKRNSYKDVQAGDICVFGDKHIEIITSIQKNSIADDGFCSIGAGRASSPETSGGDGTIRCDSFFSIGTRELENNNNTYFYI